MATAHASVSDIRPRQLGQPAKQLRRPRQVEQLSFSAVCRTQSRNVRYLGIVTCHIESDTCLVATPWQRHRKLSTGVLRRMGAVLRK